MKFIIAILNIILCSSMIMNIYGISNIVKLKDNQISSSNPSNGSIKNMTVSSIGNKKRLLTVIVTVDNKNIGNKTHPNFITHINANDPSPISFSGNSSGTSVKLGMGMYSVSESPIPGYTVLYSNNCFGGTMSNDTRSCVITNTYSNTTSTLK